MMTRHFAMRFNLLVWILCLFTVLPGFAVAADDCRVEDRTLDDQATLAEIDSRLAQSADLTSEEVTDLRLCRIRSLMDLGDLDSAQVALTSLDADLAGQYVKVRVVKGQKHSLIGELID